MRLCAEDRAAFLARAGWAGAETAHLAGDASSRSYLRLRRGADRAVLMQAPGAAAETAAFLRIAAHLAGLGLSPPRVLEADPEAGFVLLEDLGDDLYTTVIARDPAAEPALMQAAAEALLALQAAPPPPGLQDLSAATWADSALLVTDFYAPAEGAPLAKALQSALQAHADGPRVILLRDFHAGNLLWLPDRRGLARVGLLDFQDAQLGQPAYDLVSLLQDARRDVSPAAQNAALETFSAGLGLSPGALAPAFAALGALRALRILGIFARLCLRDGKPGYLIHLPRVWRQLQSNLAHPALTDLRATCARLVPEPGPAFIEDLRARCGSQSSR